jgi:hypothetical protein
MNTVRIYCCCCEVATGVAQLVGGFGALGASPNLNVLFIAITRETTINSSTNHTQCVDYLVLAYSPPAKNACVPFEVAAKPDLESQQKGRFERQKHLPILHPIKIIITWHEESCSMRKETRSVLQLVLRPVQDKQMQH